MAGISRSGDAAPVWLSDENGNVLGGAANPLNVSGGGGGGGGGVVTQPTASQLNAQVVGNVASGATDAGNPVKVGGVVSTSVPTGLTTGQRTDNWMSANGAVVMGAVSVGGGDGTVNGNLTTVAPNTGVGSTVRPLSVAPSVFNGSTWDRQRGDTNGTWSVATGSATAAVGIVPTVAANASSLVVKASAGNFYGGSIVAGATAGFLIAYNAATAPAAGATLTAAQILGVVQVSANGSAALGEYTVPDRFGTGIVLLFSTAVTTYTVPANNAQFLRGRAM